MVDDSYYCLPFETDTFTLTINNASDEVLYEWDFRTWELIEQNNNDSEVTIAATPNAQTIFLTVTSGCSVNKYYYDINRSLDESYEILNTSESLTCLNEGDILTFYIPDVTENGNILEDGSVITMNADQDSLYTFNLVKPNTEWESATWNIYGGLTLISQNDSSITVKCADGKSYNTKYSKYSSARITVSASKLIDDEIPEGYEDCAAYSDCNPDYSTGIHIYKTFDWSSNAIVGNDCITAGDSITFSVAPWVSLLYVAGGDT